MSLCGVKFSELGNKFRNGISINSNNNILS